jgi:hypothetical protein
VALGSLHLLEDQHDVVGSAEAGLAATTADKGRVVARHEGEEAEQLLGRGQAVGTIDNRTTQKQRMRREEPR